MYHTQHLSTTHAPVYMLCITDSICVCGGASSCIRRACSCIRQRVISTIPGLLQGYWASCRVLSSLYLSNLYNTPAGAPGRKEKRMNPCRGALPSGGGQKTEYSYSHTWRVGISEAASVVDGHACSCSGARRALGASSSEAHVVERARNLQA